MEIVIIVLITLLSVLLLWKNFDLGIKVLLVLSTLLHKEVFSIYKWDFLPIRFYMLGLGLFLAGDVLVTFYKTGKLTKYLRILKDPLILLLSILWAVRVISIYFSQNLPASLQLLAFFTTMIALGVLLYQRYAGHSLKLLGLIKFYIYLAFGLTVFGYFQLWLYAKYEFIVGALWNVPGHTPRIGSTFWDVNHFAALLALLLPVLGVLILFSKTWKKKLMYTGMFVSMTGLLVLTSSRTAWIIALVSFLSFIILFMVRRLGSKGVKYILVALVLISIPFLREYSIKSSPFRAYVKENFHYRLDSFASHVMLLQGSFQIFEKYPVLGGGYGSFFEHFSRTDIAATFFGRDPAAFNTRVPAHTIWGEALAETGVVGFSVLLLFVLILLGVMLFGALKLKNSQDNILVSAMFSSMLGVFVAGIFYSYNTEFFWLVLFLFYLLSLALLKKEFSYRQVFEYFTKSHRLYLAMIAVISFGLIFARLGANHLIPWDEAIYAKIAKNMVIKDEYLNLYWKKNILWFEKPPLVMWLMAMFMKLLGFTSLAARLPSALLGFGTVIVTYLLGKKLFGTLAGYLAALSLVTGIHFLYYSRAAMTDVAVTFFISLSIYLFLLAKEKQGLINYFCTGLAVGLAVMAKGVIGVLPLMIFSFYDIYLLWADKKSSLSKLVKPYVVILLAVVLIALPWHLLMYLRYGRTFLDTYLLYHVVDRATQAIEEKGQPFYWYVTVIKVSMRIWFPGLLAALPLFVIKSLKKERAYALFSIWFLLVFLLFSAATSKIIWYVIPLYPAAAIMVGALAQRLYEWLSRKEPVLKEPTVTFLFVFGLTLFSLMYLFYVRNLVYTSDLTGSEASLMEIKDAKLGTDDVFTIDRVPLPLVLYYTDSPYNIVDFEPTKGRTPAQSYDKRVIVLAKRGRFEENIPLYKDPATVVAEDGDYILWYHESALNDDLAELKSVETQLAELEKDPVGNFYKINSLQTRKEELIKAISVFKEVD